MINYNYKYCLLSISNYTLQHNKEIIEKLKQQNINNDIINQQSKWNYINNYFLSGSIQILYTNNKRTQKQIEKDYYQQLFEDAYNNYDYFNRKDEDDYYEDNCMDSNEECEFLTYKSKENNEFKVDVTNNSNNIENQNDIFELTVTVPKGFDSIAIHISDYLKNLVIKDENGVILKEIHNKEINNYGCYILGFNICTK